MGDCRIQPKGIVFDIKRGSRDDGPGIRTTVFLKGCPLHCVWCHSPESIKTDPELVFFRNRCVRCGACVNNCPEGAQEINNLERTINRYLCKHCGACTQTCYAGALEIKGCEYSADELVGIVEKDAPFFKTSGGGVTLSGGEPTLQYDFTLEVLRQCQTKRIHTALDTCGLVNRKKLITLLGFTDLVLLDIKHMDPALHFQFTGAKNNLILDNLKVISSTGTALIVRIPLIPGHNDSDSNIRRTAAHLQSLGICRVDILSFNDIAGSKYQWLGAEFRLSRLKRHSKEDLETIRETFDSHGMTATIR
jgi:pyruvate formate lyase activating enzyme